MLALPLDGVKGRDAHWALRAEVIALRESIFRADGLKSKKHDNTGGVRKVTIVVERDGSSVSIDLTLATRPTN